jgi:hypothetical protein
MLESLDEALSSAGLLLRARLTQIPEARAAFVTEAGTHRMASDRLQHDALWAYSEVLPLVAGEPATST